MFDRAELFDKLLKLHAPGSRYTYYPRRSVWSNSASSEEIQNKIRDLKEVEVYLHMPFCRELCTFCGCNVKITANEKDFTSYTNAIQTEWINYKKINPSLSIKRLYIGGGTPNYLTIENYEKLFATLEINNECSIEIEVDPRNITEEFISFFKNYSVERIIVGIQEIDEDVLVQVNRKSNSYEIETNILRLKELNPKDITGEFIYGLPLQTSNSILKALDFYTQRALTSVQLYPLAPVPWNENVQKSFGRYEPLRAEELNEVLSHCVMFFESRNFLNFHFGFFSKKNSYYCKQKENKILTRTIMGTLPHERLPVLGLGPSSISSINGFLLQNEPLFEKYVHRLQLEGIAISASHKQEEKERSFELLIDQLICSDILPIEFQNTLKHFIQEGLIDDSSSLCTTPLGKNFTKYLCHALETEYFR